MACIGSKEARKGIHPRNKYPYLAKVIFFVITTVIFMTISAAPLTLLESESLDVKDSDYRNYNYNELGSSDSSFQGPVIMNGGENETLEYQADLILRCEAYGKTKPNISWEYNDRPLRNNLIITTKSPKDDNNDKEFQEETVRDNNPFNDNNNSKANPIKELLPHNINLNSTNTDLKTNYNRELKQTWVEIQLPKLNMAFYGKFTCVAENKDGVSVKEYNIVPNANSSVFMKLVRTSVALCIISAFAGFLRLWNMYMKNRKLLKYEKLPIQDLQIIHRFQNGIQKHSSCGSALPKCVTAASTLTGDESMDMSTLANTIVDINAWVNFEPYDDRKEVSKEFFNIDTEKVLQTNGFGTVLQGKIRSLKTMKWYLAAVKTFKSEKEDITVFEGLLTEIKLLSRLTEENPFIVNLQGAYTKKLYKRQLYLFVDFCKHGPLDKYIDTNHSKFIRSGDDASRNESENDENQNSPTKSTSEEWSLSFQDLTIWSTQIAKGMKFLHNHNILHGNLCTQNIFLTHELVAKIGNIGYSPKCQSTNNRFPPECRLHNDFTNESDVWCFGLTLWELYSLRQTPLPNDQDLIDFYSYGNRLTEPTHSTNEINEQLYLCLNPDQEMRPDFEYLLNNFKIILELETRMEMEKKPH